MENETTNDPIVTEETPTQSPEQIDYTEQLDTIIELLTPPEEEPSSLNEEIPSEYGEQLDTIIQLLETFNSLMDYFVGASGIVMTYGYIFVPLIFIVLMLWWFFRQFLERFR